MDGRRFCIRRLARLDAPWGLHPVMICGTERRRILLDDKNLNDFVKRLTEHAPETKEAWWPGIGSA